MILAFDGTESPCGLSRAGKRIIEKSGETIFWNCGCKRITVGKRINELWCRITEAIKIRRINTYCFEPFTNGKISGRRNSKWMVNPSPQV